MIQINKCKNKYEKNIGTSVSIKEFIGVIWPDSSEGSRYQKYLRVQKGYVDMDTVEKIRKICNCDYNFIFNKNW